MVLLEIPDASGDYLHLAGRSLHSMGPVLGVLGVLLPSGILVVIEASYKRWPTEFNAMIQHDSPIKYYIEFRFVHDFP